MTERDKLKKRFSNQFGNYWQEIILKAEQERVKLYPGENMFEEIIDFIMREKGMK